MAIREEEKKSDGANASTLHHNVYVRSEDHGWVPGRVIHIDKDAQEAVVEISQFEDEQAMMSCTSAVGEAATKKETYSVDLKAYDGGVLPLQNTDDRGLLMDYEDMVDMPYLHEVSHQELNG